jgi:hypothetical protein
MKPTLLALAIAAAAVPQPARAQSTLQASSITLGYASNNGCTLSARSLTTGNNGTEVWFYYRNDGTNWIAFSVQATLRFADGSRTVTSNFTDPRGPQADGVVRIVGVNPPILGTMTGATVTISGCSTAPTPGGPPRNWR